MAKLPPSTAEGEYSPGKGLEVPVEVLRWMLHRHQGDIKATATAMKMGRALLYRLLVTHGIKAGRFRE